MWREMVRGIRVGVIWEERNRKEWWKGINSEAGDERPSSHGGEGALIWTAEHEEAFQVVKRAIMANAMASPDLEQKYHLAVDASQMRVGSMLFQLNGISANTEANNSQAHRDAKKMKNFMSFRLGDAEMPYFNSEREALPIIRWMAISLPYTNFVHCFKTEV